MAIAFDTSSSDGGDSTVSSISWSHTCTGSDLVFVLGIGISDATNSDRHVDSASYDSEALTEAIDQPSNGDNIGSEIWFKLGPSTGENTVSVTLVGTILDVNGFGVSLTGVAQSGQPDATAGTTQSSDDTVSTSITTVANDSWIIDVPVANDVFLSDISPSTSQTEREEVETFDLFTAIATFDQVTAGAKTMTYDGNGGLDTADWTYAIASFSPVSSTIEQEGFSFGDDDGNEASHTLDTQDTNSTAVLGVKTVRLLANATGDPPSTAYKLKFQKDGSGGYEDVPIVSSASKVDLVIAGSDSTADSDNATVGPIVINLPSYVSGDLIIIAVNMWQNNNDDQDITWPTGPQGETITSIETGYGGSGNEDIPVIALGWFIGTATDAGGNHNFTVAVNTRYAAALVKVPAGEFDATTPVGATTSKANSGTSNVTDIDMPAFTAGSDEANGKLLAFGAADQTAFGSAPSGWTALETLDGGRSAMQLIARDSAVTDSESVSAATMDLTGAGSNAMAVIGFIVRSKAAVTNEVYISTSGNVASGGENTTFRLAAPSGKSTSDFDTGRRWDDENGSDSIDITLDDYTEFEWILTTQSPAATDDFFEFRLFDGDTVFETYTVTPKWTIGTAAAVGDKVSWLTLLGAGIGSLIGFVKLTYLFLFSIISH